jgi:hypothetical protein
VDEDLRIAAHAKSRRQAQSARRRIARGLPAEVTPEERMRASARLANDDRQDEAEA